MTVSGGAGPNNSSETAGAVDVDRLVSAIDNLHALCWDGTGVQMRAADELASALGFVGDPHEAAGSWLRERLTAVLS